MLYLLVLGCRGGGLCVICAKSVAVTLLRMVCFVCLSLSFGFDKKVFISLSQDEKGTTHCLLQLTKCKPFVCLLRSCLSLVVSCLGFGDSLLASASWVDSAWRLAALQLSP